MKTSYIITSLVVILSIVAITTQAQNSKGVGESTSKYSKMIAFEVPSDKSLAVMQRDITEMKENLKLLKSSGVNQEVLDELQHKINSKEAMLSNMTSSYEKIQETFIEKQQSLKELIETTSFEELTINQLSQQLGVTKEEISLAQINDLLNSPDIVLETKEKLEKLVQEVNIEQAETLATNKLNKGRYQLKEVKNREDDVKELLIQDKLDIKNRMFWELDLGLARNNMNMMSISPLLGYQLSERFSLGVGPTWQRIANAGEQGKQMNGRLMARVAVVKNIFSLQVENVTNLTSNLPEVSIGESAQLLGGRLNLPEIKGKQLNFTLLRNLSQQKTVVPSYMGAWQAKVGIMF